MATLIITEKTSQAKDLAAALGSRYGKILPAEGHLLRLAEPGHYGPPTPELADAMHKLTDREIKAGRLLDHGGLMPLQPRGGGRYGRGSGSGARDRGPSSA